MPNKALQPTPKSGAAELVVAVEHRDRPRIEKINGIVIR